MAVHAKTHQAKVIAGITALTGTSCTKLPNGPADFNQTAQRSYPCPITNGGILLQRL